MSKTDTSNLVRSILEDHNEFWNDRRPMLKRYRETYMTRWWNNADRQRPDDTMVRVEVAEGYSFIETYIASLFTRAPSVEVVAEDVTPDEQRLIRWIANRWLVEQRNAIENGSKLALIYPMAFLKCYIDESSNDPLKQIRSTHVDPWWIILDRDADSWESQRYVGHNYFITLPEAQEKFGRPQSWKPRRRIDFWERDGKKFTHDDEDDLPDQFLFVEIVELYDLLNDRVIYWTPDLKKGAEVLVERQISPRTSDDQPLPPIVPLYYGREPDQPLMGYSSLSRVYDQIQEKNILRTWWANAVRRDSRQWLMRKSEFDETDLSKITSGQDGTIVPIDTDEPLGSIMVPVPVTPITTNHDRYLNFIDQDLRRGTLLAAFTQGEATRATATEVAALSSYTASEIGKLARERDDMLEKLINVYLNMLRSILPERHVVSHDGEPAVIRPNLLDRHIRIGALDQASTPISEAMKRQNLLSMIDVLVGLGVPKRKILEQLVRDFDLPDSFLEQDIPEGAPQGSPPPVPTNGPQGAVPTEQTPRELSQDLLQGIPTDVDVPDQ